MNTLMMPRAAFPPGNPFDGVVKKKAMTSIEDPFLNAPMQEGRMPNVAFADAPPVPRAIPVMSDGQAKADAIAKASRGPMSGPAFGAKGAPVAPRKNVESFDLTRDLSQGFGSGGYGARASAADGAVRTGRLSDRGAVPKGRPMDAGRRLDMLRRRAWTRGDEKTVLDITQQQAGFDQRGIDRAFSAEQSQQNRDFSTQRDQRNFEQSKELRGLDQAFMENRDATRRQDALDAEHRGNARRDMEWNRGREAEAADRANQGIDSAFMMTMPDGSGAVPMVRDKSGNARMSGGFMPSRPVTTPPTPGEIAKHISENMAKGIIASYDAKKGAYDYAPLKPGTPQSTGSETTTFEFDADGKPVPKGKSTTTRTLSAGTTPQSKTGYW